MRKWFASLAVLGLTAAAASAQTIPVPPIGGLGQTQGLYFDSGPSSITSWKVFNPTAAGDAFNVDFDDQAGNMEVTGVALNTYQTTSTGPIGISYVMVAPDSAVDTTGTTPDINAPYSMLGSLNGTVTITGTPGLAAGFCPTFTGYDLPNATIPTTGGCHTVMNFLTGDSALWLCSDNAAPDNRSYYTLNDYSTAAIKLSGYDLHMRIIGVVNTGADSAYMTVNNSANQVSISQTGFAQATLWSTSVIQPTAYIQGVLIPSYPWLQIPPITLYTGYENGSPITNPNEGTVGDYLSDPSTGPCVPAGLTMDLYGFYLDWMDLKPKNNHPKIKKTNAVGILVTPNPGACNPCFCFGQSDDGALDGTIWKVQNPAGSRDYFNVNVGTMQDPNTGGNCNVAEVDSVQIASWDFCGSGPSWGSIGLYEGSTADPQGTPDLANPVATASTLSMAPNASDFSYPGTTYDWTPDVFTSTSSALAGLVNGHVAAKWATGDTCTWMASDTDGVDDDSGPTGTCTTIPSTDSYFTLNGYSTSAIAFTSTNWMERVVWQ
jgi:hypothetical protein